MTKNLKPLLGETTDRDKAFPGVASLEVVIEHDPYGMYGNPGATIERFHKSDVPRRARCINPRCQQGGFDLQQQNCSGIVRNASSHATVTRGPPKAGAKVRLA